jgi:oxygen-dependent protoporphyrinogen oxidase
MQPGSSPQHPAPAVVVVGGGIAGLATAYELHTRGLSFVVLEQARRPGGVVLSEEIDGFVVDAGPDALLTQKPEAIRLCQELGLGERLVATRPPRIAYIQRGGRLHPLPAASVLGIPTKFGPFIRTRLFSWAGKLRMGAELFVPPKHDDADESIGAFITRRFGREATTYLAEPLLAGIHAGDVDRLSVRALFPRFVEAERRHGSLLRAFRAAPHARRAGKPETGSADGVFRSLPRGLSELVEALTRVLPPDAIRLGTAVARIERDAASGDYVIHTSDHGSIRARAVVSAAPAYAAASILADLDAELSRLCGEVPYASAGTVALAFDRDAIARPLVGSGFVVPRAEGTGILAASWLSSKWPHRAPEGRVLMRTFVGGARDPGALERTDEELVSRSLDALRPFVGIQGAPLFTRVYRWIRANAQHEVGHLDRLAAIDRALARHPGLFVTGSGFRGVGVPDCVADGRATGRAVAEFLTR